MRPTGTQCRHSSVLKLRCNAATHPQHNFNIDQFEEIGIEVTKKVRAFYWFCRPHTIIGTVSSSISYLNWMLLFCICIIPPQFHSSSYMWTMYQILGITSVSLLPMKSLDDLSVTVLLGFLEVSYDYECYTQSTHMPSLFELYIPFSLDTSDFSYTGFSLLFMHEHLCSGAESVV